jgi:nicotinamidase/pyrazinamidase
VCGLATDYCVKFTALDALKEGFKTNLIEDASRWVNLQPNDVANAVEELRRAGVRILHSSDVLKER